MFCVKHARKTNATTLFNLLSRCHYSRRSDKSTNSYKVVQANGENLDDVDGAVLGINSNWELLTPRGFRFYLPGSIGPGWSDVTTTVQVRTQLLDLYGNDAQVSIDGSKERSVRRSSRSRCGGQQSMLRCVAQDCPLLLRKGIEELFPGCLDVGSPQLTIITISQMINSKVMKWNKEMETEKLVKYVSACNYDTMKFKNAHSRPMLDRLAVDWTCKNICLFSFNLPPTPAPTPTLSSATPQFVLAASDICGKLRRMGYWADFINPFSGQPHLNLQKNSTLYKTDERFRCLGFKILHRNSCKVISYNNNLKNFLGNLYTTAPASTEFLKEILRDCELVNINEE